MLKACDKEEIADKICKPKRSNLSFANESVLDFARSDMECAEIEDWPSKVAETTMFQYLTRSIKDHNLKDRVVCKIIEGKAFLLRKGK